MGSGRQSPGLQVGPKAMAALTYERLNWAEWWSPNSHLPGTCECDLGSLSGRPRVHIKLQPQTTTLRAEGKDNRPWAAGLGSSPGSDSLSLCAHCPNPMANSFLICKTRGLPGPGSTHILLTRGPSNAHVAPSLGDTYLTRGPMGSVSMAQMRHRPAKETGSPALHYGT